MFPLPKHDLQAYATLLDEVRRSGGGSSLAHDAWLRLRAAGWRWWRWAI